ncbi:unnamed protein product [Caenorhabditis angaria]|uniref:BTB domain-containing protein n=1 Tax=Caenorhabditis angaria TaxID=860376 RepID=A0A9P1I8I9_9PELO|nr:unnamed protein product [Caenorhabditis angaria]
MKSPVESDDSDSAASSYHHHENREWIWAQKLARRLEQVLNVHPEKYQNGCNSQRGSRQSSPDHNSNHHKNSGGNRSRSADFGRAGEMAGNDEEANGMLLKNNGARQKKRDLSPQRGTPDSRSETYISEQNIITINVSGMKFQTFESTLSRYPNSLLGDPEKRKSYYVAQTDEYFFDRHRTTFESILYIYQSNGRVKRPEAVPIDIFLREMRFFQMGDGLLEEFWIAEGYEKPKEVLMPENKTQRKIWELMEYPDSSVAARVVAFISIAVIAISIISFCWETVPDANSAQYTKKQQPVCCYPEPAAPIITTTTTLPPEITVVPDNKVPWFFIIELVCIIWFTIELFLRFISCPCKMTFCTSILNIIDFVAIAPFFVNLILSSEDPSKKNEEGKNSAMSFAVLRVLRLVRVFRVFKLSRHSVGLQILGKTFRASVQEFCLLIFFMAIALVLFASSIYYAEQTGTFETTENKFSSIPASFWFVLVTMTTVGYGDLVPVTPTGKIVGGMCAMIGVLTLALPVPIIVANFKHFYRQENRLASMKASNLKNAEDDENEMA